VNRPALDQARALLASSQPGRARDLLRPLCDDRQTDSEVWFMLAAASAALHDTGEVIRCCRAAIVLSPGAAQAHYNLGVALQQQGDTQSAIRAYQDAVLHAPGHANSWANLGKAYKDLGDFARARESCERVLSIQPGHAVACNTLGLTLREQGLFMEALPWFERARTLDANYAEAHWNWALTCLNLGHYKEGWSAFEWRFVQEPRMQRALPFPAWEGAPDTALRLLVCAEQGVGDQIMFAGCLPDVQAVVGQVVLEADRRLQPLFQRSFPGCVCLAGHWDRDPACPPDIGGYLHGGSLPRLFRPVPAAFPHHQGYLRAAPAHVKKWADRYAGLPGRTKIGISWRGGNDARTRMARSIALADWLPVLECADAAFVNLQYGEHTEEIAALAGRVRLHHWPDADPLSDLDDFAAQIAALDLVISVDNTTVHMAGALGVPVWTLLPVAPDWRWVQNAEDSPWYPSMRLFHQTRHGEWLPVIQRVAHALPEFVKREPG
jgi:Flp pilus assembly protein TadD